MTYVGECTVQWSMVFGLPEWLAHTKGFPVLLLVPHHQVTYVYVSSESGFSMMHTRIPQCICSGLLLTCLHNACMTRRRKQPWMGLHMHRNVTGGTCGGLMVKISLPPKDKKVSFIRRLQRFASWLPRLQVQNAACYYKNVEGVDMLTLYCKMLI